MNARAWVRLALACLLGLGGVPRAAADEGLVELRFEGCDAVHADSVRARLAIELPGATRAHATLSSPTVVTISCALPSVRLAVNDPLTGKALVRTISLPPVEADVRARIVAIAVAELVAASWIELEANPTPRVVPSGARPAPAEVADALRILRRQPSALLDGRLRLTAIASTQIFVTSAKALWGGGLRLAADPWRRFGWAVDLLEHHGEVGTGLGGVAIDTITLGASALAHRDWSRVAVRGGLGFRIGATVLRGQPSTGSTARAADVVWAAGGPFGTFGVHVLPVRGLVIELATEVGYWLFPTGGLVDGRRDVAVEGPWVGAQLGIGISL